MDVARIDIIDRLSLVSARYHEAFRQSDDSTIQRSSITVSIDHTMDDGLVHDV